MPNAFCIGSLNLDLVYRVDHFALEGETIRAHEHQRFLGGKGLNQSIALARAGANVRHIGVVGPDGEPLEKELVKAGINTASLYKHEMPSGHAIIQIAPDGKNSIIVFGGANQLLSEHDIEKGLSSATQGDWVVLQNETSSVREALAIAKKRGLFTVVNPSPADAAMKQLNFADIDVLILNETEGEFLSGSHDPSEMLSILLRRYPTLEIVLTLGADGVQYAKGTERYSTPAEKAKVVDTTAAGDTFLGYFVAQRMENVAPREAIQFAQHASALCVTRPGAASSIPLRAEVEKFISSR
jgi:ribokinase